MRYILSTIDVKAPTRPESVVNSYELIREALEAGREGGYDYFIIYDTLEQRTIINYGGE